MNIGDRVGLNDDSIFTEATITYIEELKKEILSFDTAKKQEVGGGGYNGDRLTNGRGLTLIKPLKKERQWWQK